MASSRDIQYQIDREEDRLRRAASAKRDAVSRYNRASGNDVDRCARQIRDAERDIDDAESTLRTLKSAKRDAVAREEREREEARRRIEEAENRKRNEANATKKKGWW